MNIRFQRREREIEDAINHSIIAKQHQGGITTSIYLPNLAWIVCKYKICEIQAKYTTFPMLCIKSIGSTEILTVRHLKCLLREKHHVILYHMVNRILKKTSNIQTKLAKDKHWVDISLQSRFFFFSPYRYPCSCSKWTRRKSCSGKQYSVNVKGNESRVRSRSR